MLGLALTAVHELDADVSGIAEREAAPVAAGTDVCSRLCWPDKYENVVAYEHLEARVF